jgi:hypothetical protein
VTAVLLLPSRRKLAELRNMEPTAGATVAASPVLVESIAGDGVRR